MYGSYFKTLTLMLLPVCLYSMTARPDRVIGSEFCLEGQFNLGARLQGKATGDDWYNARYCYLVEFESGRIHFSARGKSNPDMDGDWTVSYLVPDIVRIVNRDSPPDIEFYGKSVEAEAGRLRRVDPVFLLEELATNKDWTIRQSTGKSADDRIYTVRYPGSEFDTTVVTSDDRIDSVRTVANFPLRGTVPLTWSWTWNDDLTPDLQIRLEDDLLFEASSTRRDVSRDEFAAVWRLSGGQTATAVPGDRWPSSINIRRRELAPGVHYVFGVRTGFGHLVVETEQGLIVGDAPANWIETHQLPAADLVPGNGVSGISERLIDFLHAEFPDTPIRAVALTHVHDDHAGGARAFAAAGADVYAPATVAAWLEQAFNRDTMPSDRLAASGTKLEVIPVSDSMTLADVDNAVSLVVLPSGPHADTALGVWAREAGIFYQSDLHVPRDDSNIPRADRLVTECWFAEWAVNNLPEDTMVINSHSPPATLVSRLAQYLASDGCQSL